MKKLAVTLIVLTWFSFTAFALDDVAYSRNSARVPNVLSFYVPSEYPTIQSAIDAAARSKGKVLTVIVEEGIYRESVLISGINNLKLIGRKARILPPADYTVSEIYADDVFPHPSFSIVDCDNFSVDGFTFIGDDFTAANPQGYPMSTAVHAYNSCGTVSNNIIFNYFDGIVFQVDDPRWLKGAIADNYIHNCLWSGIYATGSQSLKISNNKIAFTIPKELSISVGIWTFGGMGIISGNLISSYRRVDFQDQHRTLVRSEFLPLDLPVRQMDYLVVENKFQQSSPGNQFRILQTSEADSYGIHRNVLRIKSYFVNIEHTYPSPGLSEIVMLPTR